MKKKMLFVLMLIAGVVLVPSTMVRAFDLSTEASKVDNSTSVVFGNGGKVVIEELPEEIVNAYLYTGGAHITVYDTEGEVVSDKYYSRDVSVYGGSNNAAVESSSIVFNGGTVTNIFAGGKGSNGTVEDAHITINGGSVGYDAIVGGTLQGGYVYGGGDGANVGSSEITINKSSYQAIRGGVVGTGTDGTNVEKSVITINGGAAEVMSALGTATLGSGKIVINGGGSIVWNGYYWPEGTAAKTSTIDSLEVEVWRGNCTVRTTGVKDASGTVIPAKRITKLSYRRGVNQFAAKFQEPSNFGSILDSDTKEIIPYITLNVKLDNDNIKTNEDVPVIDGKIPDSYVDDLLEELGLSREDYSLYIDEDLATLYDNEIAKEDGVTEVTIYLSRVTYKFMLVYGKHEVYKTVSKGYRFSKEELDELFNDLKSVAELTDEEFSNIELYYDKELSDKVDPESFEVGEMNNDLTLYLNFPKLRESDELEEIPNTADINLVVVISTLLLGGLGLGYTIKKRRFN